ncbi:MFS transporter [Terrimonas rubra]|uniref:MFS transporter n=1 Tax=Terrimonas rubra TaxID=1035890 RepID=A0ABW6A7Q2_9BACT
MYIQLKEKIGYGLGDAASSMFWKVFSMYLLFFYTDVFGLDAAVVGTMFLITRIWDSFFDPVVGVMADRTQSKWGKFRPYLLWIAIPFGLIGVITFYTPDFGQTGKLIYAYITYSLMMMIYSLINVPYASLLGVMSSDTRDRNALSSYRMVFAFGGSLVALWGIEPLVKNFGNGTMVSSSGWVWAMVVFSLVAVLLFWGCFYLTKERVKPVVEKAASLKDDIKDLFANKPWWILSVAAIAALVFNSIRDGAAVYYFKYYVSDGVVGQDSYSLWSATLSLTTLYLVIGQASNIIGVVLATPLANRFGKKQVFFTANVLAASLSILFYFLDRTNVGAMLLLQCIISICAGSVFPLLWSMYADIADFSEWRNGRRATGLIFSSSSMAQKFGWTIGGAATGWLLASFGFKANVVQSTSSLEGIKYMLSFLPAAGAAIAVIIIFFYPLHEQKVAEVSTALASRNGTTTQD